MVFGVGLFLSFAISLFPQVGTAAPLPSRTSFSEEALATRGAQEALIRQVLARETVRQRLAAAGMDANQVSAKLASLSPEETQALAAMAQQVQSGTGIVEAVLLAVLIVVIFLVVIKLYNKEIQISVRERV